MFETYVIQPIFNALMILYTTVGDFGVAIILFTIAVRMLMWPLLRRQLHQGRIIRKIQPQIKEIRKQSKGDKQKEARQLSELYKKNGVSMFGSLGLLFIQLPIFFGLFNALKSIIQNPERIINLPYDFVASNAKVQDMFVSIAEKSTGVMQGLQNAEVKQQLIARFGQTIDAAELQALSKNELHDLFTNLLAADHNGTMKTLVKGPFFDQHLFGVIDLSGSAILENGVYVPVLIIAILAGVFQYFQTKQLTASNAPEGQKSKSLREIMKGATEKGEQPDQSEISAAMSRRMSVIFAPLIALISATSPSGLALYFASSGLVGLLQQRLVLREDVEEMELVADVVEQSEAATKNEQATNQNNASSKKAKSKKTKPSKAKKSAKKKRR